VPGRSRAVEADPDVRFERLLKSLTVTSQEALRAQVAQVAMTLVRAPHRLDSQSAVRIAKSLAADAADARGVGRSPAPGGAVAAMTRVLAGGTLVRKAGDDPGAKELLGQAAELRAGLHKLSQAGVSGELSQALMMASSGLSSVVATLAQVVGMESLPPWTAGGAPDEAPVSPDGSDVVPQNAAPAAVPAS
jgi:hypothetical protein